MTLRLHLMKRAEFASSNSSDWSHIVFARESFSYNRFCFTVPGEELEQDIDMERGFVSLRLPFYVWLRQSLTAG